MDVIATERRGRVLEITLERPKANAFDAATSRLLGNTFKTFLEDDDLSVAILTARGRFFSAGWDLKAAGEGEAANADQGVGGFAGLTEYWNMTKPVIAAVNGLAYGGGFELALASDMIIAAQSAKFALPEVKIGIIPDGGGLFRLLRRLPRAIAMQIIMSGEAINAEELARWGIINRVVPDEELMNAAREVADMLAQNAPLALQAIKETAEATEGVGVEEAYKIMRSGKLPIYDSLYGSEDAAEGIAAFNEKRDPVWKGR